jgi:cation-transporting ATPase 13A1
MPLWACVKLTPAQRANAPPQLFFTYQRDKFNHDPQTNSFSRTLFPCDARPKLATYQAAKGLTTIHSISAARSDFGKNTFDIPVPTFAELFAEHAVAPFFVFQLFCVGLWFLDEYWYYSLFTLFMLVVFECTTVFQVR